MTQRLTVGSEEFAGRTMVMSGGSRGIGLEIARAWASGGGNIAFLAKTSDPDPRLPGTVHTATAELEAAGGQVAGVVGDLRDDEAVANLAATAMETFGGIDVCVNNASVLNLAGIEDLSLKRYDLMQDVNARGTFALTQACLAGLKASENAHVLTLSPPVNLDPKWLAPQAAYAVAKYSMTLLTLGFAQDLAKHGIAANCLWPATTIKTAAVGNLLGGDEMLAASREPAIVADAAIALLRTRDTGRAVLDEEILAEAGITDLDGYGGPGPFQKDFFLD